MSILRHVEDDGKRLVIRVQGNFDFHQNKAFRLAYCDQLDHVKEYVIDLAEATYIDSSALSMLLLLHERAEDKGACVIIRGVNPVVKQVLGCANFEKLFTII